MAEPALPAELIAVRHGQSTANVLFDEARATGAPAVLPAGYDPRVPLSALGREQAAGLGGWLAGAPPDAVVVSPYVRARETWEGMAREAERLGCRTPLPPAVLDERLRDRGMGIFDGHNGTALRQRDPEEGLRRERAGEWDYRPPGGESLHDVAARVRDLLRDHGVVPPGRRVLLVAHDAVVVALRHLLGGEAPARPWPVPNASVSRWTGDGSGLRLAEFGVCNGK
ncbi:histidine phosphatase family protein [Streptomyces sp. I05A-00742]|uniref:histidine phosphatase family protein n=1 Tax=Streptomyces sp. I05A-00742 TaxID=2732853 RepID=UPI0028A2B992|nr:histidine phosphatase family protein [Streptomyces sp. I05A-00742]